MMEERVYVVGWASSSQLECTSESSLPMTGLTPKVAGVPVESEMLPGLPSCWPGGPHSEQQGARRTLCSLSSLSGA